MRAIRLLKKRAKPIFQTISVPIPSNKEILVRMQYSHVNPADLATIVGAYDERSDYPLTIGLDGSGIVESVGSEIDPDIIGKRVAAYFKSGS